MCKVWESVNLTEPKAYSFRAFLRENKIRFETSGNGKLVHFEVFVGDKERKICDEFLAEL